MEGDQFSGKIYRQGFSRLELLVVLSLIALISAVAFIGFTRAKDQAKFERAQGELRQLRSAIGVMESDTKKWPYGCWPEPKQVISLDLSGAAAGILLAPQPGDGVVDCRWSGNDLAGWRGPYASSATDPWGHPYYYYSSYVSPVGCGGEIKQGGQPVLLSFGVNGVLGYPGDCDDIVQSIN